MQRGGAVGVFGSVAKKDCGELIRFRGEVRRGSTEELVKQSGGV